MEGSGILPRSLYIHVPFCRSRCAYCDFHSAVLPGTGPGLASACLKTGKLKVQSWLQAIGVHLSTLKLDSGWKPYTTMYIGGGTPTILPTEAREDLLQMLAGSWAGTDTGTYSGINSGTSSGTHSRQKHGHHSASDMEWTIECNPDDLDGKMLDSYKAFGVNRLSVGVQSLEDPARQVVQRRGRAAEILSALGNIARQWKQNWSVDFMYGLPCQTPDGLAQDIRRTIDLGAGHVSLYQLTLEEGTSLFTMVQRGEVRLPDQDLAADQYCAAAELLRAAGYHRYEVSNWAMPGQVCLHNLHYWRMDDWDAIGPAGVSNHRSGMSYIRGQNSEDDAVYGSDPCGSVAVSTVGGIDAMFEFLMMALRTSEGFSIQRFHDIFGRNPVLLFGNLPEAFPDLIQLDSACWRPTDKGMDMLNRVLVAALEAAGRAEDP